ncbi:hypothetical protein IWQ57_002520 [Coemansia nantahalensis]|uniref:Uncharacterized protein n=1 Tax=Coemansia nantahalensis TaxID=2789366 RepID=A0ACC1K0B1_9FUNG|nr:hypothetical protein IWQ57_002520 [Coemansia nantahalensis]
MDTVPSIDRAGHGHSAAHPVEPTGAAQQQAVPPGLASASAHPGASASSEKEPPEFDGYILGPPQAQDAPAPGSGAASVSPALTAEPSELSVDGLPPSHSYTYLPAAHESSLPSAAFGAETASSATSTHCHQPAGATRQKKSSRPPRNNNKFKRFRNAFIYFVNDQRQVEEEVRNLKNREFLRLMSARWKSLPQDQREPYVRMAEEDKSRYNEDVKRFGKYESRQRKCLRGDTLDSATQYGSAPYSVPSAPQLGALASAPYLLPAIYGAVPAAPFATPQTTPPASAEDWHANPHYLAMLSTAGGALQHAVHRQPVPPALLHQGIASGNVSASSVDGLHMQPESADGHLQWARLGIPPSAAMRAVAAASEMPAQMPMADKLHAATLLQQSMSPRFMPTPSGAPVMHALTEPAVYDGGHASSTPNLQFLHQQHLQ